MQGTEPAVRCVRPLGMNTKDPLCVKQSIYCVQGNMSAVNEAIGTVSGRKIHGK